MTHNLNSLTTEPTHYAIYELKLFDALFKITNDNFFQDDIIKRRKIFSKLYPTYVDKNYKFLFSLIGVPNPYFIDIFHVTIDFISNNKIVQSNTVTNIFDKSIPLSDRAFFTGDISKHKSIDRFVVKCLYGGGYVELYRDTIENSLYEWKQAIPERVGYDLKCFYDAECDDLADDKKQLSENHVTISPDNVFKNDNASHYANTQARLVLKFKNIIDVKNSKYLAFIVNSEQDIKSVKFTILDKFGKDASRYYRTIVRGKDNVLLISFIGFNQIEFIDDIFQDMHIIFFTKSLSDNEVDDFTLIVKDIFLLKYNAELSALFEDGNYFLVEKE